ncbi:MAG: glycosyltransferase family 4 protein [Sphingobium sp.]
MHSSFSLGGKEARAVRLMNLWGGRATHAIVSGDRQAMGAAAAIDPAIKVDYPDAPPLTGRPSLARYRALARFMAHYDLIFTYNWGAMDAVMAHRLFNRSMRLPPLIHHEDGFNADEANGLKPQRNLFRRIALARAHALVVPSMVLERIARTVWKQPAQRVHLIRNGIDVAAYASAPAPDAIPALARSPGKLLVGTLAGLRPVKNLPRLVRAVAPHRDRLQLVIVGEGPERAAILAEAAQCGLDDICLAGFMDRPAQFVGLFDIFALSSDSEQCPISLVEAMAARLPVVSTDVGDVANMVAQENRPFVVRGEAELSAALGALLDDPELRARLGDANCARAASYFAEDVMEQTYAALYDEALGRAALAKGADLR